MKRIPFGQESRMIQLSPTCTGCGVSIGLLHIPGCEAEECPVCGRALVYCRCGGGLSPSDEFFYLAVLAADLENRSHVGEVQLCHVDSDHQARIDTAATLRFMATRPDFFNSEISLSHWNGAGKPEFSNDDLGRALPFGGAELDLIQKLQLERKPSPSGCWC